jgi:prepilin signal peptidase PulO-like enzyme (type II secretory pathway)
MIVVILTFLGLSLGSFVNALVFRLHEQSKKSTSRPVDQLSSVQKNFANLSILSGRSMCPNCGHQLSARDLVPIFSWILLKGRCKYCKKPIHWQYPAVELAAATVFVTSYLFWPGGLHSHGSIVLFVAWLATSVGLLALLVCDFRWMLLPSKIIYPTLIIVVAGRLTYLIGYEPDHWHGLIKWILSVAVSSGLFWLIFMSSKGAWIGYGDVRLGLITGTVLADPLKSLLMVFVASLLGLIFTVPTMIVKRKGLTGRIPYGPFLITATAIVLLFGQSAIDWYRRLFLV